MAITVKDLELSRWETTLFERRKQIDVVKKGLWRTVLESVVLILLVILLSPKLSKGTVVAAFAVYIGFICFVRTCFGLSVIGYKRIICQLMKHCNIQ